MSRRAIGFALVVALAVTAIGCQKLPGRPDSLLPVETLTRPDAIPAAWGNLVAVSTVGQYPDLVQLWFQDEQKIIRVVVMRPSSWQIVHARVIYRN
jgi:hypothetical protein